jgi:very-short-patch-repair endonuclease
VPPSLARRRRLRRDATLAEAALWSLLRGRRLGGFKFRRQHPCGPFILDFFCAQQRLAIELDGGQHFEPRVRAYDDWRSEFLAARRINVVRFRCDQVLRRTESVLVAIAFALGIDGPSP